MDTEHAAEARTIRHEARQVVGPTAARHASQGPRAVFAYVDDDVTRAVARSAGVDPLDVNVERRRITEPVDGWLVRAWIDVPEIDP